jgi:Subtilase family
MFCNPLNLPHIRSATVIWLGSACLLLAGCSRSDSIAQQASSSTEQTTPEGLSPDQLVAPAKLRKELFDVLGVQRWHEQGLRGKGVKVAILDSGFRNYRSFLGKGLPAQVTVQSFRKDGNLEARDSQHGIYCGEVVHALAPEAELLLVNWEPDSPPAFLQAVRWVKSQGAKIFSCSLIMPNWSDGEGGGEVHRGFQPLLGDGSSPSDVLCFASAGNTAQRHWCGLYAPKEGWHCWNGTSTENVVQAWGQERIAVELYGPVRSHYELVVHRQTTGELVGKAILRVDSTKACGRAVVLFEPEPKASYTVRVHGLENVAIKEGFHLVVLGGSLQHTLSQGSIPFPGDGASVVAVGAVDAQKQRLQYSSCGPNSRVPKPDFVATVPFPSLCQARPFAGTSAAAPQAAGVAAMLWSRHQDWTPNQIYQAMRDAAVDLGPRGHDWETGYGLIRLPQP